MSWLDHDEPLGSPLKRTTTISMFPRCSHMLHIHVARGVVGRRGQEWMPSLVLRDSHITCTRCCRQSRGEGLLREACWSPSFGPRRSRVFGGNDRVNRVHDLTQLAGRLGLRARSGSKRKKSGLRQSESRLVDASSQRP
jgi:hypothetical protein